jgi:predicted permease
VSTASSNRPVAISLQLYRALAASFPYEFQTAYGEELVQVTEESVDAIWRRHGMLGLARLILDIVIRLHVEYLVEFWQDVKYGLRMLAGSPGFTAVALLSLTLGIGVATSAFSEMNGFVLRDIPQVSRPDELVLAGGPTSYPNYKAYSARRDLFYAAFAYLAPVPFGVSLNGHTERTWGHLVTPSYFPALGVRPALGRFFGPEHEQTGRAPDVVVSNQFWRNHLGSDGAIVGKTLRINGRPCTVIGVGPEDFTGASPMAYGADLWLPVAMQSRIAPELGDNTLERHDLAIFHVVGRLQPGVPAARAEAALDAIAQQLDQQYGEPARDQKGRRVTLLPGGKILPIRKQDMGFITGYFVLLGGMILLIASSNVANMMLARAADRRKEIAIRLALGAGRGRLVRQLLTECMLVALAAGVLGFLMAIWAMRAFGQMKMPYAMPITINLEPDGRVLIFTLGLTILTGLAFGLLPALRATRTDLTPALKEGGNVRLPRFRRLSLRNMLVLSQVAGSLTLLLITGFLVIGHQRVVGGPVGFDPRNLVVISLDPVRDGETGVEASAFLQKLLDRVKGLPGIRAASLSDSLPLSVIGKPGVNFAVAGPDGAKVVHGARRNVVGRDYFNTIGIPILSGRGFRKEDEADDSIAAIVSEKLVDDCWPGQDPLGRRLEVGSEGVPGFTVGKGAPGTTRLSGRLQVVQVVGVAKNVRDGLAMVPKDAPALIYLPLRPADMARPTLQGIALVTRTVPGVDAIGTVRREIAAMDDKITPFNARTMTDQIDQMLFPVQAAVYTYGFIGVFGLILAAVGLAGVTAYAVSRRRREIGIRIALGARAGDVLRLVMKESLVLVTVGSVIGFLFARAGTRVLESFMSEVARMAGTSTSDPVLLVGAPLLLGMLALVACYVPARRSTKVDPAVTLRQE